MEIDFFTEHSGRSDAYVYEIETIYYWYPETMEVGLGFRDAHINAGYVPALRW